MLAETTLELAQHPDIIAIKEASGNIDQVSTIIQHKPNDFLVISGDDALTLPLIALGADGLTSVLSNALPKECAALLKHAFNSELGQARIIHYQLIKLIHLLFQENNPAGIKALLSLKGICSPEVRLPLLPATLPLTEAIKQQLNTL